MAKRRNLKKEKALRNQAYARKFRKRNTGRFGRRFNNYQGGRQENNSDQDQDNQDSNAATADHN
ncbi:hypothetical protein GS597_07730 [Synechococcales cyanobacterium C]|uniref:Uncharacterized protein n=1 Tax=Petrachloros mirabilis ULC683 TaxID=2781853 RepID=A0A8K1ZYC2_9CYAN|nr:hypothetical protein [Petrachloros mirabilis]NCJ06402.1 hypothetical protein [Petrachloros mirabilis ULC683]